MTFSAAGGQGPEGPSRKQNAPAQTQKETESSQESEDDFAEIFGTGGMHANGDEEESNLQAALQESARMHQKDI